jgi:cobalt-zinc-cadmium efflux system outer membrane protein
MNRRIDLVSVFLCLFWAGQAFAQSSATETLSLKQALDIAFEQNPDVRGARKDARIAETRFNISSQWENPELDVEVGNLAKDLGGDSHFSARHVESEIKITQPVQGWGKTGLQKKIAKDELLQREAALNNVWINVVKQIKEQYARTLLQKKAVELADEVLALNQRFLDRIKTKFDSGEALNHELSRARLEVINARNELLAAQKMHIIHKGRLNVLLGQPMSQEYELVDTFQKDQLDYSYEELLAMALTRRGDVFIQKTEVEKKNKEWILARRGRLPDYGLSLLVEREEDTYKGGAGITFQLPIWNFRGNEIRQAELEREKAEIFFSRLKDEVALEIYMVFHEVDLARRSYDISLEAVREANEILRLTTLGYEEGEVTFLAYLENLRVYQETKLRYFESLSEYAIKIAELEQVIGGGDK